MKKQLYPKVENVEPSAPPLIEPDSFRLQHITKIQQSLQDELEKYSRCRRKYNSAFKTVSNVHSAVSFGTLASSSTGLGLVVSGIGAPAGIVLAGIGVGCGIGSLIADVALKKINKKLQKHIGISQLANSKITSVQRLISTAINDGSVSDQDFKTITEDYENYQSQKQGIQSKMMTGPTDLNTLKARFLEEGKKLGMEEANKRLHSLLEK